MLEYQIQEGQRPKFSRWLLHPCTSLWLSCLLVYVFVPPEKCTAAGRLRREMVNLVRIIK